MLILVFSVLLIIFVTYSQLREGMFTAATMFINVLLAGILTFHFWEPFADQLDVILARTFLGGYEDFFVLIFVFSMLLIVLRTVTNKLSPSQTHYPGYVQQLGAGFFGFLTGYLVVGFLVCALQTLPWHENFLGFQPRSDAESPFRKYIPPDRAWLSIMRYTGAHWLARKEEREDVESPYDRYPTFDRAGTFELRYARYRRYGDKREPLKYEGELDRELQRK